MAKNRLELTPALMKVMAHPVRVSILRLLELRSQASVTSLAGDLGETTASISYHLRKLAGHGFVEEFDGEPGATPERRRPGRRQRWWRMAVADIHSSGFVTEEDPEAYAAEQFLLRASADQRARTLARWYATARQWSADWQLASTGAELVLRLDPTQTRSFADDLAALVERYRTTPPTAQTRPVEVQYAVFPADTGGPPI